MAYKASNNAYALLAVAMNTTDTTLQVATGKGDLFPVITGSDHTRLTLENAAGDIEEVKVTARASGSDSMTVVRAQDGTTAKSWIVGDIVECRPCAAAIADLQAEMAALDAAHVAASDPHTQYATDSDLTSGLAGKSNTGHTHSSGEVSGLGTAAVKDTGTAAGNVPLWENTLLNGVSAKIEAYTVVAGDRGKLIDCDGTWTLALTAAATLGAGFAFGVRNSGSGTITINPYLSETIDGETTIALAAGESCLVACDGTAFKTVGKSAAALPAATASNDGYMTSTYAAKLDGLGDTGVDGVGTLVLAIVPLSSDNTVSGGTVAGSKLSQLRFDSAAAPSSSGVTLPGTWKNVSSWACNAGGYFALFRRTV